MEVLKKHIVIIVFFFSSAIGMFSWSLIQRGGEAAFNEKVDARINLKLKDDRAIDILLQSNKIQMFTKNAAIDIRKQIIESVIKSDSSKISMRAFVGSQIGIRDEKVLPLLSKLMKEYNNGGMTTVSEFDSLVKRHVRMNKYKL